MEDSMIEQLHKLISQDGKKETDTFSFSEMFSYIQIIGTHMYYRGYHDGISDQ